MPVWRRVALAVCMFLITAAFGFLQPFVPLYLEASGLTRADIGIVAGVGAGMALIFQPFLGRLSDRLDARRPIMIAAAACAGLAYASYRHAHDVIGFTLLTAIGVNGTVYLNAAGGVLVGRMVGRARGGRAYAGYRVWGSVGYIIVALLTGYLLNHGGHSDLSRAGLDPVFRFGPLVFIAIACAALLVPDARRTAPHAEAPPTAAIAADSDKREAALRTFLVAFFLYQFGLYGASAYLSLYLKALGGSPLWITGMFAAGVVCEVAVMTQIGHLADLYGRRPVLAIAFLVMPIRMLMYIPANGPLWVLMVQTLHGLNFGIMGAIAVVFVNDLANDNRRGAAQARLAAAGGLATAIGPALCGWIAHRAGMGWMFAAMSAVGAMGAVVFMLRVPESHSGALPWTDRLPAALRPAARWLAGKSYAAS